MAEIIYIGLGSNLGDRRASLQSALNQLGEQVGTILRTSSIYSSEPWGEPDQPWFWNMVVQMETSHSPQFVMQVLLDIERALGRERQEKNGPRIMDLDILLFGQKIIQEGNLQIPHPRMGVRNFVLIPLMEIAENLQIPGSDQTVEDLYLANQDELEVCLLEEE